jgi:hypothetical protein
MTIMTKTTTSITTNETASTTTTTTKTTTTEIHDMNTIDPQRDFDPGFASPASALPPPPPGAPKVSRAASTTPSRTSKSTASSNRRATIGKILATGLTSTTVFALTAAIGWTASAQSDTEADQVVFDQVTGTITLFRNGVAIESRRVTDGVGASAATIPATAQTIPSPTPSTLGAPTAGSVAPTDQSPAPAQPASTEPIVIPLPIPAAPVVAPAPQGSSSGSH